jgi:predicted Zn-dependent peptidase
MTAILLSLCFSVWATPPAVKIEPLDFKPAQADRVVLNNGVVVFLKEDHELPLFDLQLWVHVSPADETVRDTFSFFGTVWRSGGTTSRTPEQLNRELDSAPMVVETSATDEALLMTVSCLSKDLDKTLTLFTDILLHPAFNEEQIALERSALNDGILRKNETPNQIARRAFRDVVYGKKHVYAYEPTVESIRKVTRKHLLALHKQAVVPDQTVMAVSGDFKKDELIAALNRLFESWKPTGRTVPSYDYAVQDADPGRLFFVSKDAAQSRITVARVGPARQ